MLRCEPADFLESEWGIHDPQNIAKGSFAIVLLKIKSDAMDSTAHPVVTAARRFSS